MAAPPSAHEGSCQLTHPCRDSPLSLLENKNMEQQTPFYRLPGLEEWPTKRLPLYHQIDNSLARNIYHEEFHVSNWNIWFNSFSLIQTNRDEICMLAINNTSKRYNKEYLDQVVESHIPFLKMVILIFSIF